MAVFKYEGTSASGQQLSGVVEAFDEFEALEKAKVTCRVVSKITPVKERPSFLKQEIGSGKIKSKVIAIMCSQFAIIIASGMGMARCVELVAEQTSDKGLKAILDEVAEDVAAGHSLANSFESKGGAKLPILFYETIRAGEQAGTLDQSFDTLHKYYDKSSKTKAKVAQALTYPVFVIFIAIVVVAVMMVAVIPTFKNILSSYDAEMPLATQILINASDFMAANILWIVLVLAAVALGVKLWTKTERGRVAWSTFKLKLPALGRVAQLSNAAQYANTMSTLLASGLQMTHAVDGNVQFFAHFDSRIASR
ncbi:type II secretion system F family protein [Gordonibacter sp.]|uniref:type II secretion system F family protein n=1 Tax=Gordonibacter sp. TaxID=1968902 RepID=UPI0025C5027D|nr:type II secretion system F family protein [Gordonibacter sp.]